MNIFTKEIELIDLFCNFLDKRNCIYKREVRKASYHNDGYIDIVIRIEKIFISVEAKLNNFQSVLYQASGNTLRSNYSYILYPRSPRSKWVENLKDYTIGLIIYNPKTHKFEILVRAKKSKYLVKSYLKRIKRNWIENRCGRIISKREIPENYDLKKIEALRPDYKWVKTYKEKKIEALKKNHKTLDNFF